MDVTERLIVPVAVRLAANVNEKDSIMRKSALGNVSRPR
jgi:hypothetical protein